MNIIHTINIHTYIQVKEKAKQNVEAENGGNTQDEDKEKSGKGDSIEAEWRQAIENNDNKKIKHLFKEHHKQIKFLKIKFDNGDNSLHCAIRAGNSRLAKFLIILKMNVSI